MEGIADILQDKLKIQDYLSQSKKEWSEKIGWNSTGINGAVLSHLHRSNQQHKCKRRSHWFRRNPPPRKKGMGLWQFINCSRIGGLVLLQKDQTQFWNEKSISKPHILLALNEETIAILYTLQTFYCSPVWGQEISGKIWTIIYRGLKGSKICLKTWNVKKDFKNSGVLGWRGVWGGHDYNYVHKDYCKMKTFMYESVVTIISNRLKLQRERFFRECFLKQR